MNYDVIGDIHGQLGKLVSLLSLLGYAESGGLFRHPSRTAIFVGDLIDRGPEQLATVDLVQQMVQAGSARCVLGNHEFNAIAWVTPDPQHPGKYLRDHHTPGNRKQHQAFLDAVEGTRRQAEITDWLKTLPLWLDLGELRVVHACWHQEAIDRLRPLTGPKFLFQTESNSTTAWDESGVTCGFAGGYPRQELFATRPSCRRATSIVFRMHRYRWNGRDIPIPGRRCCSAIIGLRDHRRLYRRSLPASITVSPRAAHWLRIDLMARKSCPRGNWRGCSGRGILTPFPSWQTLSGV
jgi:hypothetical protein